MTIISALIITLVGITVGAISGVKLHDWLAARAKKALAKVEAEKTAIEQVAKDEAEKLAEKV